MNTLTKAQFISEVTSQGLLIIEVKLPVGFGKEFDNLGQIGLFMIGLPMNQICQVCVQLQIKFHKSNRSNNLT